MEEKGTYDLQKDLNISSLHHHLFLLLLVKIPQREFNSISLLCRVVHIYIPYTIMINIFEPSSVLHVIYCLDFYCTFLLFSFWHWQWQQTNVREMMMMKTVHELVNKKNEIQISIRIFKIESYIKKKMNSSFYE